MSSVSKTKLALSALLIASAMLAGVAHANEVNLIINNTTSSKIYLVSGSPYGKFPPFVNPGEKEPVKLQFGGTRSDIEVVYKRTDTDTACRFTASHIEKPTLGPFFDKSAESVGTGYASCQALQSPTWRPPYNYSAEFAFYY